MNKYQLYAKHEREREDLTDELNRGRREIDKGVRSLDGWADRIMAKILSPIGDNLDKYPLGHNIPQGKNEPVQWNI